MLRNIALTLVATVLLTTLTGCISSGSVSQYDGPNIGDHTLAEIKPDETSQAWVLAVLGEPTSKAVIDDPDGTVEVWKWVRRKITTIKGSALVVSSKSKSEEVRTVYVEFKDGVVTRAWRD
jgi:outer membrane protein assembly factor BamE (lipoprotein component of BamABCDE complex)